MTVSSVWTALSVLPAALIPAVQLLMAAVRGKPCSPAVCAVGVLGRLLNGTLLCILGTAIPAGRGWVQLLAAALAAGAVGLLIEALRRQERRAKADWEARQRERLKQAQEAGGQGLQTQLEELRRLLHDLRHYLAAAGSLRAGAGHSCPAPAASVLEAVVRHYVEAAAERGIQTDIQLERVDQGGISTPDLCLVVGNLLENAVEAVVREPVGGLIRMRCASGPGWLSIVVGNTFTGRLRTGRGEILSSKGENRRGMGLESVRQVAARYGGRAEFTADGAMFRAAVFLNRRYDPL